MSQIPQTSYSLYFTESQLGMPAYAAELMGKVSRIAKGIIYYGRLVIQSRLKDNVCRMPRQNQVVILDNAGTFTAGSIATIIAHGTVVNEANEGVVSTTTTITTSWTGSKAVTMAAHAAAIKAALSDCYSCTYNGSANTITYIGDGEDIVSSATTMTASGYGDTGSITSDTISSADVAADVLGLSFNTHNRQQQFSTGITYYSDKEPVNICRKGTVWVYGEEAVAPSSSVYGRFVKNTAKYQGYVGASADSGKCLAISGAKYAKTTTEAGLVPLEINLPQ